MLDEANLIHDTQLYPVMRKLRSVFAGSAFSDAGLDADAKMYLDLANVRVGAGVGGPGAGRLSSPVVEVAAGAHHSVARLADGRFFTWGEGEHGALGHGSDNVDQLVPKQIAFAALGEPCAAFVMP